jgi:phosphoadenosine phosphosulfate reductase
VRLRLYGAFGPAGDLLARRTGAFSVARPAEGIRGPFVFLSFEWGDKVAIGKLLEPIDECTPTEQFIGWTLDRFRHRKIVLTTSFGMEGCALIDMYAQQGGTPTVVYLDTGFFFPETYALRDRMVKRYPRLTFVNRGTSLTPEAQARRYGPELWRRNPDQCCSLRKLQPLRQVLTGADVWITAITRSQGGSRSDVQLVNWDCQFQVLKICPLVRWDRERIWEYVQRHKVPYNELHERGYPSIGCTHCTVPVHGIRPNQYSREGRWPGTDKIECGLHTGSG